MIDENLTYYLKKLPKGKTLKKINKVAHKYNIPEEIILGIFVIENTFRPLWFRSLENIFLFWSILKFICFKTPIPNYTVGVFQIGLGTALEWQHCKYESINEFIIPERKKYALKLLKTTIWKTNLDMAAWKINQINLEASHLSNDRKIRYIGLSYNGYIEYALVLESIANYIVRSQEGDKSTGLR